MTHENVLGWTEIAEISLESRDVPITASVDPTGTDPQFALGVYNSAAPSTAFADGEWDGSWVDATTELVARTPIIGGTGTLEIVSGRKYDLWVKLAAGGEEPAWVCGWIRCP